MILLAIIAGGSLIATTIGVFRVHFQHKDIVKMHQEVTTMLVTIRHANEIRLTHFVEPSDAGGNIGRQRGK